MTFLSDTQMQEIDGEGFWEGFACGSLTGIALGMTFFPDASVTKLYAAKAWLAAVTACGIALT